jgi:hypothetical protein
MEDQGRRWYPFRCGRCSGSMCAGGMKVGSPSGAMKTVQPSVRWISPWWYGHSRTKLSRQVGPPALQWVTWCASVHARQPAHGLRGHPVPVVHRAPGQGPGEHVEVGVHHHPGCRLAPAHLHEGVGAALLRGAPVVRHRPGQRVDRGPHDRRSLRGEPAGQPHPHPVGHHREIPLPMRLRLRAFDRLTVQLVGHLRRHQEQDVIPDDPQEVRIILGTQLHQRRRPLPDIDPRLGRNPCHRTDHHIRLIQVHRTRRDPLTHHRRGRIDPLGQPHQLVRTVDGDQVPVAIPHRHRRRAVPRRRPTGIELPDEPHNAHTRAPTAPPTGPPPCQPPSHRGTTVSVA